MSQEAHPDRRLRALVVVNLVVLASMVVASLLLARRTDQLNASSCKRAHALATFLRSDADLRNREALRQQTVSVYWRGRESQDVSPLGFYVQAVELMRQANASDVARVTPLWNRIARGIDC